MPAGDPRPWRLVVAQPRQTRPAQTSTHRSAHASSTRSTHSGTLSPEARGDIRPLVGRPGEARLRVGDWRAILRRDDAEQTIYINRVLPRGRAYER